MADVLKQLKYGQLPKYAEDYLNTYVKPLADNGIKEGVSEELGNIFYVLKQAGITLEFIEIQKLIWLGGSNSKASLHAAIYSGDHHPPLTVEDIRPISDKPNIDTVLKRLADSPLRKLRQLLTIIESSPKRDLEEDKKVLNAVRRGEDVQEHGTYFTNWIKTAHICSKDAVKSEDMESTLRSVKCAPKGEVKLLEYVDKPEDVIRYLNDLLALIHDKPKLDKLVRLYSKPMELF